MRMKTCPARLSCCLSSFWGDAGNCESVRVLPLDAKVTAPVSASMRGGGGGRGQINGSHISLCLEKTKNRLKYLKKASLTCLDPRVDAGSWVEASLPGSRPLIHPPCKQPPQPSAHTQCLIHWQITLNRTPACMQTRKKTQKIKNIITSHSQAKYMTM